MATELVKLEIHEISMVDRGAAPDAVMSITKRKDPTDMVTKTELETVTKSLETAEAGIVTEAAAHDITKALVAVADTNIVALVKYLGEHGFDVDIVEDVVTVEKRAEVEYLEVDGEQIEKSLIPAVILKRMEADAAELVEKNLELAEAAIEKRLTEVMPNVDPAHGRVLLKALDAAPEDAKFAEFVANMDALFAEASTEIGKREPKVLSADDELEDLIKAYRTENASASYEVAYTAISKTAEGKVLVNKSYKKD